VLRARCRETVLFPDLTERLALRLSSILTYTARAHFGLWHRKMGGPDFTNPSGVFTPLAVVELEASDVPVEPWQPFLVCGETYLAKSLDARGAVRHLVREGRHTVLDGQGKVVARAKLTNVFTRYDPDPARRRVTELPAELGLGVAPSRTIELLDIDALVPAGRPPDFVVQRRPLFADRPTGGN